MPERAKVDVDRACEIAEEFHLAGRRPSIRNVRARLVKEGALGGSHRALQGILSDWRKDRGLSEFEADTGVPPEFQTRIDALTAALWDIAHRKAATELARERRESESLRAMLAEAKEANESLRAENQRLQERIEELEAKQNRRAREFWDRVVIAIGEMLKETGPLSTAEIFEKLPDEIRREWFYHVEPIRASTIAKKLKERGGRGRYVEIDGDKWRHSPPSDDKQALEALP